MAIPRADALRRLLPALGVNGVPIAGVFLAGWSASTALSLYWWENLIGSLLVALRIALHRAATRKRGHQRLQLNLQSQDTRSAAELPRQTGGKRPGSFLVEFLVAACAATALHGVLLWVVLRGKLATGPEAEQLRQGVVAVAAFQALGFALDLVGIRQRPFAWVRDLAQATVQRVTLIHVAIILGVWAGLAGGRMGTFFGPFAVLKALADVGGVLALLGVRADPPEAPGWLAVAMNRLRKKGDFAAYWRACKEEERRLFEEDEQEAAPAERRASARRRGGRGRR